MAPLAGGTYRALPAFLSLPCPFPFPSPFLRRLPLSSISSFPSALSPPHPSLLRKKRVGYVPILGCSSPHHGRVLTPTSLSLSMSVSMPAFCLVPRPRPRPRLVVVAGLSTPTPVWLPRCSSLLLLAVVAAVAAAVLLWLQLHQRLRLLHPLLTQAPLPPGDFSPSPALCARLMPLGFLVVPRCIALARCPPHRLHIAQLSSHNRLASISSSPRPHPLPPLVATALRLPSETEHAHSAVFCCRRLLLDSCNSPLESAPRRSPVPLLLQAGSIGAASTRLALRPSPLVVRYPPCHLSLPSISGFN